MKTFLLGATALLAALVSTPAEAAVKVVTTTQDLAAITQDIGGANVEVSYIARGDLDPHFVDAKPAYMVKLAAADLVVSVGMELEIGWLPSLVSGSRNPKIQSGAPGYLEASTGVNKIEVPTGTIDRSRGDLHPQGNPHYWLDPENGRGVARVIEARLAQIDAAHAADYQKALAAFEAKLTQKEAEWSAKMAPLKGKAVIGYHSTFDYFIARYGLNLIGFVEPKPGIPPTPQHTLELSAKAKSTGAKFILIEPYHSPADAAPIASASGAKVVTLPTSVGGAAGIVSYFDLFDTLVRTLSAA
jgi:zinc/manganese transport system substrate-binding protein